MSKFTVEIDEDLQDIVPGFLENRKKDLIEIQSALSSKDLDTLEKIGHKVSGSSGGYGFHELGKIAKRIEEAAMAKDISPITNLVADFQSYLENVEIKYIEEE